VKQNDTLMIGSNAWMVFHIFPDVYKEVSSFFFRIEFNLEE